MNEKTMICECGNELYYDGFYHAFNCDCGNCYNLFGQQLRPLEDWQNEYFDDY